jgi:flavin-dependent dehydrogenase
VLDAILVDEARAAGAEVGASAPVDEFMCDGDRVTGVRAGSGRETARLVVRGRRAPLRGRQGPVRRPSLVCAGVGRSLPHWSAVPIKA